MLWIYSPTHRWAEGRGRRCLSAASLLSTIRRQERDAPPDTGRRAGRPGPVQLGRREDGQVQGELPGGYKNVKKQPTGLTREEFADICKRGTLERDEKDIERVSGFGSSRPSHMLSKEDKEAQKQGLAVFTHHQADKKVTTENTDKEQKRNKKKKSKKEKRKKEKKKKHSKNTNISGCSSSDSEDGKRFSSTKQSQSPRPSELDTKSRYDGRKEHERIPGPRHRSNSDCSMERDGPGGSHKRPRRTSPPPRQQRGVSIRDQHTSRHRHDSDSSQEGRERRDCRRTRDSSPHKSRHGRPSHSPGGPSLHGRRSPPSTRPSQQRRRRHDSD
ncbi:multiple myeloma tumor-associated protein 2 isoform X2 [Lampetra planeri]